MARQRPNGILHGRFLTPGFTPLKLKLKLKLPLLLSLLLSCYASAAPPRRPQQHHLGSSHHEYRTRPLGGPGGGHQPHHPRLPSTSAANGTSTGSGSAPCRCPTALIVVADSCSGSSWLAQLLDGSPCSSSFIPPHTRPDGKVTPNNPAEFISLLRAQKTRSNRNTRAYGVIISRQCKLTALTDCLPACLPA